jgi:hypothetical protein
MASGRRRKRKKRDLPRDRLKPIGLSMEILFMDHVPTAEQPFGENVQKPDVARIAVVWHCPENGNES